ncbi:hypothetical protein LSTR_LSTR007878 [Laodelphax striatellus]|uniref:Glycosyltransferase family 92 protein n=1 Tax=Laodelphax striatellus TaxID=195883 RepID=A0A482XSG6_LAOST|nr:hypothetical protein LSTR_LSTR007878 [Laodelphax striatellus]
MKASKEPRYKQQNISSNGGIEQDLRYTLNGQTALDKKHSLQDVKKIKFEVPKNIPEMAKISETKADDRSLAEFRKREISKRKDRTMIASKNMKASDYKAKNVEISEAIAGDRSLAEFRKREISKRKDRTMIAPKTMKGPENKAKIVEISRTKAEAIPKPEMSKPKDQPMIAPNMTAADGFWQHVTGTRYKFFVYSAYYEEDHGGRLKIHALAHMSPRDEVWCRMWYVNGSHVATTKAQLREINEHYSLPYSAFLVLCPTGGPDSVPHSVSVIKDLDKPSSNHLLVHKMMKINSQANNISVAVCVSPIHGNYSKTMMVMEFLEYYKILGASHVTLYNSSISAETSCMLRSYEEKGFVTNLPWEFSKMKMRSEVDVRIEAQLSALNECVSRQKYRFTHVAMVDLDEFIMPQRHHTFQELIRSIDPHWSNSKVASYNIRSAFFYENWPDDKGLKVEDPFEKNLMTLKKTRRSNELFPHRIRSKVILRPEFVEDAGIHFVAIPSANYHAMHVEASDAIVNHYRWTMCQVAADCLRSPSGIDRNIYRYRHSLANNVKMSWNELRSKCGLPDL